MSEINKSEFYGAFEKIISSVKIDGKPMENKALLCAENTVGKFISLTEYMENAGFNVTAIKGIAGIISRHYADSLSVSEFIPDGARLIDVGTGGGFPALPLAIAREDLHITALDSTAKKIDYVNSAAALLGLANVFGICGRAEELCSEPAETKAKVKEKGGKNSKSKKSGSDDASADNREIPQSREAMRENYDVCVSRAVAALPVLCELCLPFVRVGGEFIALKGAAAESEINAAENAVGKLGGEIVRDISVEIDTQDEALSHHIIIIKKIRNTPKIYPRTFAKINKNPL